MYVEFCGFVGSNMCGLFCVVELESPTNRGGTRE